MENLVKNFQVSQDKGVDHFNVLLIGQIGAGKSSFFNNIDSAMSDYVKFRAPSGANDSETQSLTKDYKMYRILKDKDGQEIKFRFWDTMGLEADTGLKHEQVKLILDGDVPDGTDLTTGLINQNQEQTKNKIDCCVFIINAATVAFMDEKVRAKWFSIRELATSRGMSPIIVFTHVDEVCKLTKKDPSMVFKSGAIGKQVSIVAKMLGTTPNMVCPVVNYTEETETDAKTDIMTLLAVRQILRACESRLG